MKMSFREKKDGGEKGRRASESAHNAKVGHLLEQICRAFGDAILFDLARPTSFLRAKQKVF